MLEPMSDPLERYTVTITVLTRIRFKFTGEAVTGIDRVHNQSRCQGIADALNLADTGGRPFALACEQFLMETVIGQAHADRHQ